jgi:hypothetical protein
MTSSQAGNETPQIAIWYFVGATFLFAASVTFFPDAQLWVRIILWVAGFIAVLGGGVQLAREIAHRRAAPPTTDPDAEPNE